ncbi:MAG: hypothetical protein ACLVHY_05240 [Gemmiger sp.]
MRAVLQRFSASVVVNGGNPCTIGPGYDFVSKGWDDRHIPAAAKCAGLHFCR